MVIAYNILNHLPARQSWQCRHYLPQQPAGRGKQWRGPPQAAETTGTSCLVLSSVCDEALSNWSPFMLSGQIRSGKLDNMLIRYSLSHQIRTDGIDCGHDYKDYTLRYYSGALYRITILTFYSCIHWSCLDIHHGISCNVAWC